MDDLVKPLPTSVLHFGMSVRRLPEDGVTGKHLVSFDGVKAGLSGHCFQGSGFLLQASGRLPGTLHLVR